MAGTFKQARQHGKSYLVPVSVGKDGKQTNVPVFAPDVKAARKLAIAKVAEGREDGKDGLHAHCPRKAG